MKNNLHHDNMGLIKAFLIGTVTPYATIFCSITRRNKPYWLTKEFAQSSQGIHQAVLGLGLATGLASMVGGAYLAHNWVTDKILAPTKIELAPNLPSNDVQEQKLKVKKLSKLQYVVIVTENNIV